MMLASSRHAGFLASQGCTLAISRLTATFQNNLIESASHATGSLLIWDTGEYTVLPRKRAEVETDDEQSDTTDKNPTSLAKPENEKLIEAFQAVSTNPSFQIHITDSHSAPSTFAFMAPTFQKHTP
jgi:hypothetical protein